MAMEQEQVYLYLYLYFVVAREVIQPIYEPNQEEDAHSAYV